MGKQTFIYPNKHGSVFACGVFSMFMHVCVIQGKCVFLVFWNDWQEVRECSLVSSCFCVQSSQGSHVLYVVCLCSLNLYLLKDFLRFGSRRSGILKLYILCLGTNSIPMYSALGGFFLTCQFS